MPRKATAAEARNAVAKSLRTAAEASQGYGFPRVIVPALTGVSRQALAKAINSGRVETITVRTATGTTIEFCEFGCIEKLGEKGRGSAQHLHRLRRVVKIKRNRAKPRK